MLQNALFLLVLFLTSIIKTITGFAGTTLAMPFAVKLIDATTAKVVLGIFAWINGLVVAVRERDDIRWGVLGKIVSAMLAGLIVGIKIYEAIPMDILLKFYGVFIICIALKNLLFKGQPRLGRTASVIVLLGAGLMHGMFLSGGSLLVIYATSALPEKKHFRATMSAVWVVLNAYIIAQACISHSISPDVTGLLAAGVVPFILAIIVGEQLSRRFSQETFMKITFIVLLISGVFVMF